MSSVKRKSNFEWLRVLAMGMIITLHYLFKGGIIVNPTNDFSGKSVVLWLLASFCICAVNTYILISGYFLVETGFKLNRLIGLVIQVLEYSMIILVVMMILGMVRLSDLSLYSLVGYLFPIGTEEYWFVTAYFAMYLMAPVMAKGVKALTQKELQILIVVLLSLTSIEKSILPMLLPGDAYGYDFIWFMTLFIVAAYIRLYGIRFLEGHRGRSVLVYVAASVFIWAAGLLFSYAGYSTGIDTLSHYADIVFHYNYLPVLVSSIGLFYIFKNSVFNEEGIPAGVSRQLGRLTFGVYLLHEHPEVRYMWPKWLGVSTDRGLAATVLHWLMCLVVVYAAGLLVEYVRSLIHDKISVRLTVNDERTKQ